MLPLSKTAVYAVCSFRLPPSGKIIFYRYYNTPFRKIQRIWQNISCVFSNGKNKKTWIMKNQIFTISKIKPASILWNSSRQYRLKFPLCRSRSLHIFVLDILCSCKSSVILMCKYFISIPLF